MYKPHYISTEPFSAAYMHLHVWHTAGSNAESEDKLNSSQILFVNISEMSGVIPVAVQHPVLLDVIMKEAMMKTGEPMAPLYFRGFQLHTILTQQPGQDLVCQITFPHFLGKGASSMLEYKPEKFPQGLIQGQKMAINLRQPSNNHWNIASDLILPLTIDLFRQQLTCGWHEIWKRSLREQNCLQWRHLLLGSPLKWRQEAVMGLSLKGSLYPGSMF